MTDRIGTEEIVSPGTPSEGGDSSHDDSETTTVEKAPWDSDPAEWDQQHLTAAYERWNRANANRRATSDSAQMQILSEAQLEKQPTSSNSRAEFPWLQDPDKGVSWDFDPVRLRELAQPNTWVGTLINTIVKEIAQTPWQIVEHDGTRSEASKRLRTHPEHRDTIEKQADGPVAQRLARLIDDPHPDADSQDLFEMLMADLLEVGSLAVPMAFDSDDYVDDQLVANPDPPLALQPSAPEVWTKEFAERSDVLQTFWQFERVSSPGGASGNTRGRRQQPIAFDRREVIWSDLNSRTNRRYGMPPTLLVRKFLESVDLAITQEQNYLSKGSIPSGALTFEQWGREELEAWMTQQQENIKGKPHKWLTLAGKGGDISFESFSYNFQELQFMERMRWYAKVIASAFQVPTAVVGLEPEKVNYNTFEGERQNFEANTLGPYLQKLERVLNDQLVWQFFDTDLRFEFSPGMSEQTRNMVSQRVTSEVSAGVRTPNEARQEIGLPEHEGDDADALGGSDDEEGDAGDIADLVASVAESDDSDTSTTRKDSFTDYPEAASENAQMALDAREETGDPNDCGQAEGWARANQLADREPISRETVGRMAAFDRHRDNSEMEDDEGRADCGWMMWKAWGGDEGVAWAQDKLDELEGQSSSVEKDEDEPLRNNPDAQSFTLQPAMIEDLASELDDPVDQFFESVLGSEQLAEAIEQFAAQADSAEKSLAEATPDADESHLRKTASAAVAKRGLNDIRQVIADVAEDFDLAETVSDAVTQAAGQAARTAVEDAIEDVDQPVDADPIVAAVQSRDRAVLDNYTDEMGEQILDTVQEGWQEGKTSTDIRDDLQAQKEDFTDWGAERVARQELQVATGQARNEFAAEVGKVEQWTTSGDDRVREAHQQMDGLWKDPQEDFVVDYGDRGVQKENVPGDSEPGIGCRCFVKLVDREDVDDSDHAGALT